MKLSIQKVSVPPAGKLYSKGGWSKVLVHFTDAELDVYPSVTVETHVPCKLDDTYQATRHLALERAKELLKAALDALEQTSLDAMDFTS